MGLRIGTFLHYGRIIDFINKKAIERIRIRSQDPNFPQRIFIDANGFKTIVKIDELRIRRYDKHTPHNIKRLILNFTVVIK
jgi:hypothetical protein